MWILMRVVLATLGFWLRQLGKGRTLELDQSYEGTPYVAKIRRDKHVVTHFTIGMACRSPAWIRLHLEGSLDRWFKRIGFSSEIETGDDVFDRIVYVACDHPFVAQVLRESAELRDAIYAMLEAGYEYVMFDGAARPPRDEPSPRDLQMLKRVKEAAKRLETPLPSRIRDPFMWKVLVIEGVIWSIFGFALGAFFEAYVYREQFHVSTFHVWLVGVGLALVAFLVLVGATYLLLRGSSRGHRVIIESALVLVISLPGASTQIVADTNRKLDDAPAVTVTRTIESCRLRKTRGRTEASLYLAPESTPTEPRVPHEIEVRTYLCSAAVPGATVELDIKPGRLGLPWLQQIRIGDVTWTCPR
jgi:hypothetical protein